jgi:hypothetical protein
VISAMKRFPTSYENIKNTRPDMKEYQFNLTNLIQDLSLMTDSTINGINKTQKTLNLRVTKLQKKSLSSDVDLKVWNMTIKSQVNELTDSIEKCDEIITQLKEL